MSEPRCDCADPPKTEGWEHHPDCAVLNNESTRDLDEAFFYGAPDEVIADGVTEEMASFGDPA